MPGIRCVLLAGPFSKRLARLPWLFAGGLELLYKLLQPLYPKNPKSRCGSRMWKDGVIDLDARSPSSSRHYRWETNVLISLAFSKVWLVVDNSEAPVASPSSTSPP